MRPIPLLAVLVPMAALAGRSINPMTIMPGFYRDPSLANRVADDYWGKTFLTAQRVEDVIAYLGTLQ